MFIKLTFNLSITIDLYITLLLVFNPIEMFVQDINGSFRLLSQSSGRVKYLPSMTNTENAGPQQLGNVYLNSLK